MKNPLPRIDIKRKQVCLYSPKLQMFELLHITNEGLVSKKIASQSHFTTEAKEALRHFEGAFYASFRTVAGLDLKDFKTWNGYAEAIWKKGNEKIKKNELSDSKGRAEAERVYSVAPGAEGE